MTKHTFITTAGIEIPIKPISLLDLQLAQNVVRKEFEDRGEPIDPPTYKEIILEDTPEQSINEVPYTKALIKDAPEEDKAKWDAYVEAMGRLQEVTLERTGLVFLEGIEYELPADDSWIRRRKKLFNEDVPEDEDEKLLYYINKIVLKTPADQQGLTEEIFKISMTGADEEAISAMEALFRSEMENSQRPIVEQLKRQVARSMEKETSQEDLDLHTDTEGRNNSKGVGANTKRIPRKVKLRSGSGDSN